MKKSSGDDPAFRERVESTPASVGVNLLIPLVVASGLYQIALLLGYAVIIKLNDSSAVAQLLVFYSAFSLLSIFIRFGGSDALLAANSGALSSACGRFCAVSVVLLTVIGLPLTAALFVKSDLGVFSIVCFAAMLLLQPNAAINEQCAYLSKQLRHVFYSRVVGTVLIGACLIGSLTFGRLDVNFLILFGIASSFYYVRFTPDLSRALRSFGAIRLTDAIKGNFLYLLLGLAYILPLTVDKLLGGWFIRSDDLIVYDFNLKLALVVDTVLLSPFLGWLGAYRAGGISRRWIVSAVCGLGVAMLVILFVVSWLFESGFVIVLSLDNFFDSACFSVLITAIFVGFFNNALKQRLLYLGLVRVYLGGVAIAWCIAIVALLFFNALLDDAWSLSVALLLLFFVMFFINLLLLKVCSWRPRAGG